MIKQKRQNGRFPKKEARNHKLTDFYPIRRSTRKTAKQLEVEAFEHIRKLIKTGYNEGYLRVFNDEVKGRGIRAGKPFFKDDFVVEYRGEIVSESEAKRREALYAQNPSIGSYMYFFVHKEQRFCVDATAETQFLGRLINHSYLKPNLKSKVIALNDSIHLCLFASRDISIGEELLYDYGDRRRDTIASNPWLRES